MAARRLSAALRRKSGGFRAVHAPKSSVAAVNGRGMPEELFCADWLVRWTIYVIAWLLSTSVLSLPVGTSCLKDGEWWEKT